MFPYCPQIGLQSIFYFFRFFQKSPHSKNPRIVKYLPWRQLCRCFLLRAARVFFKNRLHINMTPWKLKQQTHIQTTKIYGLMRLSVAAHSLKKNLPWRRLCRCLLLRAAHVFPQIAQEATSTIGCGEVWSCVVWVVHDSNLKSKMKGTGLTDTTYISTYFVRKGVLLHPGRKP